MNTHPNASSRPTRPLARRRFIGIAGSGAVAALIGVACRGSESTGSTSGAATPSGGTATARGTATPPAAVRGGTLTAVIGRDALTFDPLKLSDVTGGMVLNLVGESLYQIDQDTAIAGRLVERTENPEANVYVWRLRRGVMFQDGSEVNAEAVRFNLDRHRADPKSVRAQDVQDITAIEAPDPFTLQVTLKSPYAPFPNKLTGGAGIILSPTAIQRLGDTLVRDLSGAGAGPFRFSEWKKDTHIALERNPTYWRKANDGGDLPYLDKIVIRPFPDENVRLTNLRTGEADVLIGNPPYKDIADLKKSSDVTVSEMPGLGYQLILTHNDREPFNHPAARRALALALDREQIRRTVYFDNGKVLDGPVPESISWAYAATHPYLKRDLGRAKQELAAAGRPNGFKFTFQISNASPELQQVAELIKDQLREVGMEMEIQLLDFAAAMANGQKGDYQALALGWSGDTDPDTLNTLLSSRSAFNLARYNNPRMDSLLDSGRATLDQARRGEIYRQAQALFFEDSPFTVYFNAPRISTVRRAVQHYPQSYNGHWGAVDFDQVWKMK